VVARFAHRVRQWGDHKGRLYMILGAVILTLPEAGSRRCVCRTERPIVMLGARMIAVAVAVLTVSTIPKAAVAAEHKCDPVTDTGWSVVPEREVLSQTDGVPYQSGTDWLVDRVTTILPFCHYFNSIGVYSMRSYSLDPVVTEERVVICRQSGSDSVAVAPYTGPCPPR
jgi:hypothetical protein